MEMKKLIKTSVNLKLNILNKRIDDTKRRQIIIDILLMDI